MESNKSLSSDWTSSNHGDDSTWIERLISNLLSYSLVLGPIALVVVGTKFKLFPASLQSNSIVQRFVYGSNLTSQSKDDKRDSEKLIANGRSRVQRGDTQTRPTLAFIWCLLGLQISYLIWGVLQEKIMTTKYETSNSVSISNHSGTGSDKTGTHNQSSNIITFQDSQFLVFLNRIIAFILSIIALVYNRPKQSKLYSSYNSLKSVQPNEPSAPLYEYVYCSVTNILSSWCQYEALKYVNFPTQVLSKSCKIVPVMLMSKIMLRKSYQWLDYFCAVLLSTGMFIFLVYQPPPPGKEHSIVNATSSSYGHESEGHIARLSTHLSEHIASSSMFSGLIILSLYLAFDSFTSNWQQSLYSRYAISEWQMMAATNFYSIVLTLTSLHQLGNLKPAFKLLASSSPLLFDCLLMSIMSSIGQLFIFYTIKRFGSVIFAVIMTMRQFLAILLSCAIYGHRLSVGSFAGLVLVFLVVGYQIWRKSSQASGAGAKTKGDAGVRIQFKALDK